MFSFGCFVDGILKGVITYGSPPSPSLCIGVCGEQWKKNVYELNRLTMEDGHDKNLSSYFVSNSMKLLPKPCIIVSYADTKMNHVGYIYQATNFIYTGMTAKRKDWIEIGTNKHSKTTSEQYSLEERRSNPSKFEVVQRSLKHRYIYFLGNKTQVKQLYKDLNYEIQPYPKGESKKYINNKKVAQQMTFI
tara:strand:+ start:1025 stop:1594 length:570 start_codon:yes stop_codon:yes gene_type:complete